VVELFLKSFEGISNRFTWLVSIHFRLFSRWYYGAVPISLFTANFFPRRVHVCLLYIVYNLFYGVSVPRIVHKISFNNWFVQRTRSSSGIRIALKQDLLYHRLLGSFLIKLLFLSMYVSLCSTMIIVSDCILVTHSSFNVSVSHPVMVEFLFFSNVLYSDCFYPFHFQEKSFIHRSF